MGSTQLFHTKRLLLKTTLHEFHRWIENHIKGKQHRDSFQQVAGSPPPIAIWDYVFESNFDLSALELAISVKFFNENIMSYEQGEDINFLITSSENGISVGIKYQSNQSENFVTDLAMKAIENFPRQENQNPISEEMKKADIEKILDLWRKGHTSHYIADYLGYVEGTIRNIIQGVRGERGEDEVPYHRKGSKK